MTGLIANILISGLLAGLLCITIAYCVRLNRHIQTLQDSKNELAALLKQFDDSTVKASETIIAMQTASKKIGDNIQLRIDKANYLLDDLSFAIEKGTRLTSQIEASFAVNRARSKTLQEDQVIEESPKTIAEEHPTKQHAKRTAASIESIVEKVVGRNKQHQQEPMTPVGRSRAEQELIELIRSSKG